MMQSIKQQLLHDLVDILLRNMGNFYRFLTSGLTSISQVIVKYKQERRKCIINNICSACRVLSSYH